MGYVEGRIFIGTNPRLVAAELPPELQESLEDLRPWVRAGAVQQLEKLLAGNNKGLVLAAQGALASLASGDDSQQVRTAAATCLASRTAAQLLLSKEVGRGHAADEAQRARRELRAPVRVQHVCRHRHENTLLGGQLADLGQTEFILAHVPREPRQLSHHAPWRNPIPRGTFPPG